MWLLVSTCLIFFLIMGIFVASPHDSQQQGGRTARNRSCWSIPCTPGQYFCSDAWATDHQADDSTATMCSTNSLLAINMPNSCQRVNHWGLHLLWFPYTVPYWCCRHSTVAQAILSHRLNIVWQVKFKLFIDFHLFPCRNRTLTIQLLHAELQRSGCWYANTMQTFIALIQTVMKSITGQAFLQLTLT